MLQPLNPVTWHSHGPSPGCKIKKGDCWRISDLKFLRGKSTIVLSSKFDSNCSWPLHQQFFISKNSQKFRNSKNPRIPTILLQWPQKQTSPARDLAPSPASPSLAAIVEDPAAPVDHWGLRGRPLWGSPGFPWEKRLLDAINTRADREEGAKNYGSTETGKKMASQEKMWILDLARLELSHNTFTSRNRWSWNGLASWHSEECDRTGILHNPSWSKAP